MTDIYFVRMDDGTIQEDGDLLAAGTILQVIVKNSIIDDLGDLFNPLVTVPVDWKYSRKASS